MYMILCLLLTVGSVSMPVKLDVKRVLLDLKNDLRSPWAMNGRTMTGRWSAVSKITPTRDRTFGWWKSSMNADSAMKSSTS